MNSSQLTPVVECMPDNNYQYRIACTASSDQASSGAYASVSTIAPSRRSSRREAKTDSMYLSLRISSEVFIVKGAGVSGNSPQTRNIVETILSGLPLRYQFGAKANVLP